MLLELRAGWQSIAAHTTDVWAHEKRILEELGIPFEDRLAKAMLEAVRWHDYGQNVQRWQEATQELAEAAGLVWPVSRKPNGKFSFASSPRLEGKSGRELRRVIPELRRVFAPRLRHEVASALALT